MRSARDLRARLVCERVHAELSPHVRGEEAGGGAEPGDAAANAARSDERGPLLPVAEVGPLPVLDGGEVADEAGDLSGRRNGEW